MTEDNHQPSDARREAAAKRGMLKQALSSLEIAAAGASAQTGWRPEVRRRLEDLRAALMDHVSEVEASDGLLAEMTAQAPRLSNQIAQLRNEHVDLRRQIDWTITQVDADTDVDELRTEVMQTLMAVIRHRQLGSDLIYEAYSVDIGGT